MKPLAAAALIFSPAILAAQAPPLPVDGHPGFSVEFRKPTFRGGSGAGGEVVFLEVRLPVGPVTRIVAELPAARANFGSGSETGVGNPYLGLEAGRSSGPFGTFGVRLPLASEQNDDAMLVGILADFGRFAAFAPEQLTVTTSAGYQVQASGLGLRVSVGPDVYVPTGESSEEDIEVAARYAMHAWYESSGVAAGGGFQAWTLLTEDIGGVGERTIDEVALFIQPRLGRVRPTLHVHLPLDNDWNQMVGIVFGVTVSVVVQ